MPACGPFEAKLASACGRLFACGPRGKVENFLVKFGRGIGLCVRAEFSGQPSRRDTASRRAVNVFAAAAFAKAKPCRGRRDSKAYPKPSKPSPSGLDIADSKRFHDSSYHK